MMERTIYPEWKKRQALDYYRAHRDAGIAQVAVARRFGVNENTFRMWVDQAALKPWQAPGIYARPRRPTAHRPSDVRVIDASLLRGPNQVLDAILAELKTLNAQMKRALEEGVSA